ncbi:MAG: hypothetical protein ABI229_05870, partial [Gemmatimonadaceae bacterium]
MSADNETPNPSTPADAHGAEAAPTRNLGELSASNSQLESRHDVAGAALGALAPAEEAELYAAAAVDPAVSADLAAMEAVVAELARLAPLASMNRGRSAGIRSRLVARAAATRAGRPVQKAAVGDETPSGVVAGRQPSAQVQAVRRVRAAGTSGSTSAPRPVTGTHSIPFEPRPRTNWGRMLGGLALAAAVLIAAFGVYNWRSQRAVGSAETAVAPDSG